MSAPNIGLSSIILAIFTPKIIKVVEHLTTLLQKQFWLLFIETRREIL